uniref:T-complex protein 1 subunit gamma n=1 Tax=Nannospalax galili TaxID=1026970 RepID=A0A8C6RXS6_NANGA
MMGHHPVLVLSQNTKRESGRKVQSGNISAAKTIADIIRTCLGPKSMMKMLLDPMGGIDINLANADELRKLSCRWSPSLRCGDVLMKEEILEIFSSAQIPGGIIEDSCVLRGVMINKDVTHPRMRRYIKNPRIVLLDSSLEYKKGEGQTDIEITREEDFTRILQMEEEYIQQLCEDIIQLKPDVVITEKGISDLAQHYLMRANITAIRRVRKTDNNRIARACGARIVSGPEELRDDVGTGAGLMEIKKIGDEYFTFITECKDPKACTILLRGASKEILSEVERNLQDAMQVCRNVLLDPQLVPGGGASEMAVAHALTEKSKAMTGVEQWPYRAVAQALEVIPRTLIQNCGARIIRLLTSLRAKHTQENCETWGVNGETGTLVDMKELGIWEPLAVKLQTYKTAVETAVLLLRIDDIVSGHKKKGDDQSRQSSAPDAGQE